MTDLAYVRPDLSPGQYPRGDQFEMLLDALDQIYGAWSTWTPTLTNITQGNGTVVARYRLVGKTLNYRFRFILGSTSAVGTSPKFTLPATPQGGYSALSDELGRGVLLDSGSANRDCVARLVSGATLEILYYTPATGAHTTITSTAPWTWTTGDSLMVQGTIETA